MDAADVAHGLSMGPRKFSRIICRKIAINTDLGQIHIGRDVHILVPRDLFYSFADREEDPVLFRVFAVEFALRGDALWGKNILKTLSQECRSSRPPLSLNYAVPVRGNY